MIDLISFGSLGEYETGRESLIRCLSRRVTEATDKVSMPDVVIC